MASSPSTALAEKSRGQRAARARSLSRARFVSSPFRGYSIIRESRHWRTSGVMTSEPRFNSGYCDPTPLYPRQLVRSDSIRRALKRCEFCNAPSRRCSNEIDVMHRGPTRSLQAQCVALCTSHIIIIDNNAEDFRFFGQVREASPRWRRPVC